MLSTIATVVVLALATFFDLRERRIPDVLTYAATLLGIAYHLAAGNYSVVLYVAGTFAVAYLLYRLGLWAGGDVKLFTAIAALNPYSPTLFGITLPFPLVLFIASIFAAFILTFPWMLWRILRSKDLRRRLLRDLPAILRKSFVAAVVFSSFGPLGVFFLFLPNPVDIFSALALFLWSPSPPLLGYATLLFFIGVFIRVLSMRSLVFRRVKRVDELEDGDVPADFILEDGRVVPFSWTTAILAETGKVPVRYSPLRAAGLYPEDIQWLKEQNIEKIAVRTTTPFVPFVAAAYLLLVTLHYIGA
jgi:Flp pilus assembly protein protease CpaA